MSQRVVLHGRPMNGPSDGLPSNPYPGMTYYDETNQIMWCWDSVGSEWRPVSIPKLAISELPDLDSSGIADLTETEGVVIFDTDAGTLAHSDGVAMLEIA